MVLLFSVPFEYNSRGDGEAMTSDFRHLQILSGVLRTFRNIIRGLCEKCKFTRGRNP